MTLNSEQQQLVEKNMSLVGKVIRDKVRGIGAIGIFTYDDLYQIGCIGLCKAAATDRGLCQFSTYAYRLIWNEICDALISGSKKSEKELLVEDVLSPATEASEGIVADLKIDLEKALEKAERTAPSGVRKGIRALLLMTQGYSSRDVGDKLHLPDNSVRALASKARAYLRRQPEFQLIWEGLN